MCTGHETHSISYTGAYKEGKKTTYKRLCFQHATKETLKGITIEVEIDTEIDYTSCTICGH
jgi:hypothetical protein